ncbi:MAG: response regulator [Xanthomonadales bacterium]|nr:response regulator [Xanthomonadales bacterium]
MNTKSQKVLVIDDDTIVGRSFDRVLSDKGYEVTTVLSGEEALATMNGSEFDVVFTDIRMPGMDGLEVTARIKERCPWTPVVVITGHGTEDTESRASVLGASGFVHKPLTPEIIESITLKAIGETEAANEVADAPEAVVESKKATIPEARERSGFLGFAKVVGMFVGAPLIALGYVLALPLIGLYQIGKLAYVAFKKSHRNAATMVKNIGLFFASPFIALGYVIALPVVGLVMFTKLAREATK